MRPDEAAAAPDGPTPATVWEQLVDLVLDSRTDWIRRVTESTGLPFSRVRALRRLDEHPDGAMTMGELARELEVDSSAATVIVNTLEDRGLAARSPHPDSRRVRIVAITADGRRLLRGSRSVELPPPAALARLDDADLAALAGVLHRLRDDR